ncbi:MAG: cytochrome P450 [Silicimonas sp.]|nr:cytochrome P450 [Silicimonas sp.]
MLRHRQAGLLLRDKRLRQGSHAWPDVVGLTGAFADFWKRSLISQEGDRHRALRRIAQTALSEDFILSLEPAFRQTAAEIAESLRDYPSFDVMQKFAEPYAGRAMTTLFDLPRHKAAEIAHDANTLGLAMGFGAKSHEPAINAACRNLEALAERLIERAKAGQDKTGYVARLLQAAGKHDGLDHQAFVDLIVISIFGGVDTTRAQLGFAIALFAQHSDQWDWLRNNPDHIPQAIAEVIRTHPTTTWATREALQTFQMDGLTIPKGAMIHVFVHATATDPEAGGGTGFDIRARRKVHFGFGGGAHHCLGQFVARTDMAAALAELLARWRSIEIVGQPEFLPETGNTSPSRLNIAPTWD